MRTDGHTWWTIALLLVGSFMAGPAAADGTITWIGTSLDDVATYLEDLTTDYDCIFGNLGPPADDPAAWQSIGLPHFAVPVWPRDACSSCPEGFRVRAVHFLGWISDFAIGSNVSGRAELIECMRIFGCPVPPGDESEVICRGQIGGRPLERGGYHDFEVELDCPCAYTRYRYLLGYWADWIERVVVDDAEGICPTHVNIGFGLGWHPANYGGDFLVFAEAECCNQPIDVDTSSWGRVKALFGSDRRR